MIEKAREGDKLTAHITLTAYRRKRRTTHTVDPYSPELFLKQYR
jgi:hypothetical protein